MPHWKTLVTTDNLSAADLWDERAQKYLEVDAVIDQVRRANAAFSEKGATKVSVLYRRHSTLPQKWHLLPNSMAQVLEVFAGTPDYTKWSGTAVTLYVTKVKNPKLRAMTDAIRYRPTPPKNVAGAKPSTYTPEPDDDERAEIARREAEEARRG